VHSVYVSSFWGFAPRPQPGLCPWTPLGVSVPRPPVLSPLANFWLRPWTQISSAVIFLHPQIPSNFLTTPPVHHPNITNVQHHRPSESTQNVLGYANYVARLERRPIPLGELTALPRPLADACEPGWGWLPLPKNPLQSRPFGPQCSSSTHPITFLHPPVLFIYFSRNMPVDVVYRAANSAACQQIMFICSHTTEN